ncbi:MAG: hypothetical protein AAFQ10_09740 [Pseudomonadota bacterium]
MLDIYQNINDQAVADPYQYYPTFPPVLPEPVIIENPNVLKPPILVNGTTYIYSLDWQFGWNVGWTYGWTVGNNVSWHLEYTPDQLVTSWQITSESWGWALGWGWIAYLDGWGNQDFYYGWGYYSALIPQWELVSAWTYSTSWVYGWNTGWHQAWHVGWNYGWHQAWGWASL